MNARVELQAPIIKGSNEQSDGFVYTSCGTQYSDTQTGSSLSQHQAKCEPPRPAPTSQPCVAPASLTPDTKPWIASGSYRRLIVRQLLSAVVPGTRAPPTTPSQKEVRVTSSQQAAGSAAATAPGQPPAYTQLTLYDWTVDA
ncbi:hypothetical protein CF326_g1336 [Tilletia indica]|nr:hypothetical protein CF326_g1336 [Tilletia indica]